MRRRNFRDKAEACLGEPLKEGIERRLAEGQPIQAITEACGFKDARALHNIMAQLGIARRSRSESIKLQWRNNSYRRAAWGQTISDWKKANPDKAMEHSLIGNLALQNASPTRLEQGMMKILDDLKMKYEFQYVVGDKFLCDFYLPGLGMIIEVDGDYWHSTAKQRRRDISKDAYLQACGFSVLRLSEHSILSAIPRLEEMRAGS